MKLSQLCSIMLVALVFSTVNIRAEPLSQVQQKIKQQQNRIAEQRKKRNELQSVLKNQEVEMGNVISKLKETQLTLGEIKESIIKTEQQIRKLEQQEKEQIEKLKQQLDSAYRTNINPSLLERLLSDKASSAERMSVYYRYINQMRIDIIQQFRHTQEELKLQRDTLKSQQKEQQSQLSQQKKQEKALQKVKNERENTIRSLDKTLQRDESKLEELKQNEIALKNQIERASQIAQQQEKQEIANLEQRKNREEQRQATEQEKQQLRAGQGLGRANKQYRMPVVGKIVNQYGAIQAGELRWKGLVIQANIGSPVKAIADGKVILASWLEGYGQVILIDHGEGDMSLYGYNQSLSVSKGDKVKSGQVIANVGNSGGQNRVALYFEIRRKGEAVNPILWIR